MGMWQLSLDFNRLDAAGRVRIGPDAFAVNTPLQKRWVHPGDRVLVVDDEGDSCEGVLVEVHGAPPGFSLAVKLDLTTWVDAPNTPPLRLPSFAPTQ